VTRDQLFLLKRDFMDGARGPFYCPDCATLEGLLSFYPKLRDAMDVQYVDFPRPRAPVIAVVGPDNQGLPTLVIAPGPAADKALAGLDVREAQGKRFLQSTGDIGRYLARRHGIGEPH
jgi:hypothetical protein